MRLLSRFRRRAEPAGLKPPHVEQPIYLTPASFGVNLTGPAPGRMCLVINHGVIEYRHDMTDDEARLLVRCLLDALRARSVYFPAPEESPR